ncbi:hypothetical protein RQP46_004065 [Phenoliferia psychrophenolica]
MSFLSLNHLLADRAKNEANTFIIGSPDRNLIMHEHTYGELDLSANLLALHYSQVLPVRAPGDKDSKLTVALLAPSNHDYIVNEVALLRMGLATLLANSAVNFNASCFTTLPLFHNGAHAYLWRALHCMKPIYVFPASDLPLTPVNILALLKLCDPKAFHAVPFIYKQLGDSEEGIVRLSEFQLCVYGGSAMPDDLGDRLVARGVNLLGLYGATETGQLMTSMREYATDKEWQWNRVDPVFAPFCVLEPRDGGAFELVCKAGWPKLVVTNRPDGSYHTKDLFIKHPTRPVTGEKIQPVPMELTIKGFAGIDEAIVFGTARSQAGVLILLGASVDPSSSREELLQLVAPALKLANSAAPSHAELIPEMVVFLPNGTVIPKADKASFIRAKVYAAFKADIEAAYERLEGNDGVKDEDRKSVGTIAEMQAHLLELVGKMGGAESIALDTDLFTAGLDSLQAGRIRNSLQRTFNFRGNKLSPNLVFEYPTVLKLADFVVAFASGTTVATLSASEQMLALVEKYRHFSPRTPSVGVALTTGSVVVLTGCTGSLGGQLLGALLARESVETVYVLVRASSDEEANFSADRLGLSHETYADIVRRVTLVIHNAWSVNFNLNISSFEPHIRGAYNLINLCLESPALATFYFSSSVSAVAGWGGPGPVPETVMSDTSAAQGMGYAHSKWVTEKLCEIASIDTPVRAVVLRIGQMIGSSIDGKWNETEAVSLMIKSADTLAALPDLPDRVSWLPVDWAASIILELVDLPPPAPRTSQTWHIVQPRLVPWSDILLSLRNSGLKFEVVPPKEWVRRLRDGPQDPIVNPTIKLLAYYEGKYDRSDDSEGPFRWPLDTTLTAAASKAFREAPVADDALIGKFVKAWRGTGFLA